MIWAYVYFGTGFALSVMGSRAVMARREWKPWPDNLIAVLLIFLWPFFFLGGVLTDRRK